MAEPPPAPEEVWEEILLRLPPDDPASLLRASLVCKQWRRVVSRRAFLRRLPELHGAPPILGFFTNRSGFVPTTAGNAAFSLPRLDSRAWQNYLDCRHGRVLLLHVSMKALLVWEPVTGYQRRVPLPAAAVECLETLGFDTFEAAVVCAVDGCAHASCHGGPFRVVIFWTSGSADSVTVVVDPLAWASEHSSETGAWGEPTPIQVPAVTVIQPPDTNCRWGVKIMQAEDGGLGGAVVEGSHLQLWSLWMSGDTGGDAHVGWVLRRTIHLENLPPVAALSGLRIGLVTGFAEGMNVVFLCTDDGIFTIQLTSGQVRRVSQKWDAYPVFPFVSFYAPMY